ncbi:hypothetical protein RHMOL_Rhmol03G0071500 [Rhododendron molle]|uniref:Uncharacterized protein n=1 Tax=Rhododendron molle TaxID=49168 RepID=A0ACC0PBG6_RHOML|nr:hypothetical protein RHMOL_Rhmol03G0071500 [Rhododendron molle]
MTVNTQCVLCTTAIESHAPLFFDCHFTSSVWNVVLSRSGISRTSLPLEQELYWAGCHRKGKSFIGVIYKISLAATVYLLWVERNLRIFQHKRRDLEGVMTAILEAIRAKLSSLSSIKFSARNRDLCDDWFLDFRIFGINNCE